MGRRFSSAKRKAWVADGAVAREGDRPLKDGPPLVWKWHEQRACGIEEHFGRVEECAESWQVVERCETDHCKRARAKGDLDAGIETYPVGCCSRFFCKECRERLAVRFRRDFNAARQGVIWQASLVGVTSKWRDEKQFRERLITLTTPHVGSLEERNEWAFAAWTGFLKSWNEWHRSTLAGAFVTFDRRFDDASGKSMRAVTHLPEFELCQHARFWEWTEGNDHEGHPHFHVWAFGPFLPQELIERWWREAWERVSGHTVSVGSDGQARIIVDVRAVRGDRVQARDASGRGIVDERGRPVMVQLDRELVKYLTKDWGATVEATARVYAVLGERRARQASRGFFSTWAVPVLRVCATCGVAHERKEEGAPVSYALAPVDGSAIERLLEEPARGPPSVAPDYGRFPVTFAGIRQELVHEVERSSRASLYLTRGLRALHGLSDCRVRHAVIQPVSRREQRRIERERDQCKLYET